VRDPHRKRVCVSRGYQQPSSISCAASSDIGQTGPDELRGMAVRYTRQIPTDHQCSAASWLFYTGPVTIRLETIASEQFPAEGNI